MLTMELAVFSDLLGISLEGADTVADLPPVHFQFCLAGTTRTDSSAKPGEILTVTRQSRQPVFQLCEFDLKLAFFRSSAACKDVQDEACAIDDFGIERFLEILRLAGGKFVVENNQIHTLDQYFLAQFLHLAFSDKSRRIRPVTALNHLADDACAGRNGQLTQFIESVGPHQYCVLH